MTPANLVRPLRPALSVQRGKAKVPSYAVASAVAIGALAAMALVTIVILQRKLSVTIRHPVASSM